MPTLPEILNRLGFVTQETVLLGLFLTASTILIVRDWRFLILALLLQYILGGLLLARLVSPDVAVIKLLVGVFICPILFLSARQISATSPLAWQVDLTAPARNEMMPWWRRLFAAVARVLVGQSRQSWLSSGIFFRILAAILMILVATTLSQTFPLPGLSPLVSAVVYWLILVGLVILTLTENPLKVGLGLFTIFTGFDLFYGTLERSLLLTGLWGAINLLIALVIGYLTIAQGASVLEEEA